LLFVAFAHIKLQGFWVCALGGPAYALMYLQNKQKIIANLGIN
jgi:hypothetical protein